VRGVPPGPRMPRAVQTAIWSRQAQWFLEQSRARFGPMFSLKIAFEGDWVVLADTDLVKQVFTGDPPGGAMVYEGDFAHQPTFISLPEF